MKIGQKFLLAAILFVSFIFLSSSFPASKAVNIQPINLEKANIKLMQYSQDGIITYKELKDVTSTLKGEKLTLKEKILLKVFGKKISKTILNKISEIKSGMGGSKSQLVAALLCFFIGSLGIHRFYLGYTWQGIVQILTLGGLGIWVLIDFIRILTGGLQPKNGDYDVTL